MKKKIFVLLMIALFIMYGYFVYLLFFETEYPSQNMQYGPIPVFLFLTIMLLTGIFFCTNFCFSGTEKYNRYKMYITIPNILLIILMLMGCMMMYISYSDYKNNENNTGGFVETQGYFEGEKQYVNQFDIQKSIFVYSYVVDGERYLLSTNAMQKVPRIGSKQKILYDPDNPTNAKISDKLELNSGNIVFFVFGFGSIVVGLIILIKHIKIKRICETY